MDKIHTTITTNTQIQKDDLLGLYRYIGGFGISKLRVIHLWATGQDVPDVIIASLIVEDEMLDRGIKSDNTNGHTILSKYDFSRFLSSKNLTATVDDVIDMLKSNNKLKFSDDEKDIYYTPCFFGEKYAFELICSKKESKKPKINKDILRGLSKGQKSAIIKICNSNDNICCLVGHGGTGKTYVSDRLISVFKQSGINIQAMAFTGKAAENLNEKLTKPQVIVPSTIHRFLAATRTKDYQKVDVILIDEASMVSSALFFMLINALKKAQNYLPKFIFVGDDAQLPPIQSGCIFADCIESDKVPVYRLTENKRCKSLIIDDVASTIRNEKDDQNIIDSVAHDINYSTVDDIVSIIIRTATNKDFWKSHTQLAHSNALVDAINFLTLCHLYDVSDEKYLNELCEVGPARKKQTWFNFAAMIDTIKDPKGIPVIYLENDYSKGVMNGTQGYILRKSKEKYRYDIQIIEGHELKNESITDMRLAYACTVHKYQGSESPKVSYFHTNNSESRALVYTAITRAKEEIEIYKPTGAMRIFQNEERLTLLSAMLQK